MERYNMHHAHEQGEQWLRKTASYLLITDVVPKHLSHPLFIGPHRLANRELLVRLVLVLDLWRAYLRPLTERQTQAYQVGIAVELGRTIEPAEWHYLGKLCATASPTKLREVLDELYLTGQVLIPKAERQRRKVGQPLPNPVERALTLSRGIHAHLLKPQPDILP